MTRLHTGAGTAGALFLALALTLAFPATGSASGGFECTGDDKRVAFTLRGGLPHGLPGRPFQLEGTLSLKDAKVPKDLRETAWTGEHLVQNWLDGRDFRLNFYREREGEPFASVELIVTTRRADEGNYRGAYEVKLFMADTGEDGAVTLKGKVACSLE